MNVGGKFCWYGPVWLPTEAVREALPFDRSAKARLPPSAPQINQTVTGSECRNTNCPFLCLLCMSGDTANYFAIHGVVSDQICIGPRLTFTVLMM